MSNILRHEQSYIPGQLKITRNEPNSHSGKFTLEGNFMVGGNCDADHFQLIYEALVIAANSDDKFAPQFRAMLKEFMDLTADWDE